MSYKEQFKLLKKYTEDFIKYSVSVALIERTLKDIKNNKSLIKLRELTKKYPSKRRLRSNEL